MSVFIREVTRCALTAVSAGLPFRSALPSRSFLPGCTQQQLQGWLAGRPRARPTTPSRIIGLWVTSWIVLLAVGVITWGLIIWAAVVYRRRKGQTGLPVQLRYNMPIEIFYTIVPLILVLGFFAFTARDQAAIEASRRRPRRHDRGLSASGGHGTSTTSTRTSTAPGIQAQDLDDDGTIDDRPAARAVPAGRQDGRRSSSSRATSSTRSGSSTSCTRRT